MKTSTSRSRFPELGSITSPAVGTAAAAYHLNRQQNTLRIWASKGDGPLTPRRINGRLAWAVADIRRLLGVAQ